MVKTFSEASSCVFPRIGPCPFNEPESELHIQYTVMMNRPIWLTFESKNMKLMIHIICGLLVELLQLTDKTLNLKSNHITAFHFWMNNWFCILIIWVREVLTRTALGDIDWHFDSLSESWNLSHCQVVTVLFRETPSQTNRGDDQCCEIYNMNCLASGTVLLKRKNKKNPMWDPIVVDSAMQAGIHLD